MRRFNLFYGSSYDRSLDTLLYLWPDIREKYPEAQLHVAYGWEGFVNRFRNNPERMRWMKDMELMLSQEGVFHYGRVGKQQLQQIRGQCGVWVYPTYFTEINCITALESQADGLVPVVCDFKHNDHYTALSETVGSGKIVKGNINEPETQEKWLEALYSVMGDKKAWKKESQKAEKFARKFSHSKVANKWIAEFEKPVSTPMVSVVTPTIRRGFWNLMAHNLSQQTYDNFEWIVVDDFPENREETMKQYCEKHGIKNWQYLKTDKDKRRKYSLAQANNTAIKHSKGELLVWLQDFIIIPNDGLERLVDVYRHHPMDFIAPVDEYYYPAIKPDTESEDWFNGELEVIGEFHWRNKRNNGSGITISDTVTDLELNYGAIPKALLEKLGGFYEFFDDALGYDDTEIVHRGQKLLGAKVVIDATNKALCLDHWKALQDKPEQLGEHREFNLNDPRFYWLVDQIEKGNVPVVRDPKLDKKISLKYEIPDDLGQDGAVTWMREHMEEIIKGWGDV